MWGRAIARAAVVALAAAYGHCSSAADTQVVRATDLRDARYVDARVIQQLTPGTAVEVLGVEAGWVRVRAGTSSGWLRATSLGGDGATVAALARLETGRSATNNIVVALGIRRIPKASRLALIVGVDAVAGASGARWPGVGHDVESARAVARRMGVPDDNVDVVQGADASKAGIEAALDRLAQRTQAGDQVFVYYAGPGSMTGTTAGCTAAWIASDGGAMSASVVGSHLRPALVNAGKMFFVSDAAYADAAQAPARRSVATATTACGAAPSASMPLIEAARAMGAAQGNVVHLQAMGPVQGLEQATAGGLFTQAFADCLAGDAADVDKSGSVSVAEIAACIDQQARHVPGGRDGAAWALVDGNGGFVPPLAGVVVRADTGAPPATAMPASAATSPRAALDDVFAQRDERIRVEVVAQPSTLAIGKDALALRVRSSRSGYLYLILLGSDEKSFYLLFPNDLDRDNRIDADETLRLPRPQWMVQSQGPPGANVVLAVVAESPRDLSSLQGRKAGPFSDVLTDLQGRATLQWLLGRSSEADNERCVTGGRRRNLQVVAACSDAYGAARVEITER